MTHIIEFHEQYESYNIYHVIELKLTTIATAMWVVMQLFPKSGLYEILKHWRNEIFEIRNALRKLNPGEK